MRTPRPSTPGCAPPAPPTTRPSIRASRSGPTNISGCPTAALPRGVGGIFYDHLEGHFDAHFAFTRDVGEAFLDIFPQIVRKRMDTPFDEADMDALLDVPRPLRRVQPALRPRHPVRAQDRRQYRRHPDEPAARWRSGNELRAGPRRRSRGRRHLSRDDASGRRSNRRARRSTCSASTNPTSERYRELFRLVGAPWLWFSRLIMDDAALAAIIQDPERRTVRRRRTSNGRDVGMLELDFREPGECELAFVGLVPELSGQGHGRWLLAEAVRRAWRDGVNRVHVHTCSLDHPAALSRLSPRRIHAVQARDRALSRPAPARHPAAGLRASDPAAGNADLSIVPSGELGVYARSITTADHDGEAAPGPAPTNSERERRHASGSGLPKAIDDYAPTSPICVASTTSAKPRMTIARRRAAAVIVPR